MDLASIVKTINTLFGGTLKASSQKEIGSEILDVGPTQLLSTLIRLNA